MRWSIPLILLLLSGCHQDDSNSGEPGSTLTLQLNWFPDAQHGGYYAASLYGYYEEEGLDVEILPGGPNASVIQKTAQRTVNFAVANADDSRC